MLNYLAAAAVSTVAAAAVVSTTAAAVVSTVAAAAVSTVSVVASADLSPLQETINAAIAAIARNFFILLGFKFGGKNIVNIDNNKFFKQKNKKSGQKSARKH